MRVLVSPASTHGGTAEIGRAMAKTLRRYGLTVDVAQPEHLFDLSPYRGFVLGSALYRGRWKPEATKLIEQHAEVIAASPCWLFSSGPIAAGAPENPFEEDELERLETITKARDHRIFGGRLDLDQLTAPERWLARWVRVPEGDARPWDEIEQFAIHVAAELTSGSDGLAGPPTGAPSPTA